MNISFTTWKTAIKEYIVVPDKKQWNKLDVVSRWLIASRAPTLMMTVLASIFVALLAIRTENFNFIAWLILFVGLVSAHATNNLLNDFIDYITGADHPSSERVNYSTHALAAGYLSRFKFLLYVAVPAVISLLTAIWFLYSTGGEKIVWALVIVGTIFIVFYTRPFKLLASGEIMCMLAWGPMMIAGGYYVVTGSWSNEVLFASFPYGIVIAIVLSGAHIDKIEDCKKKQIRTLATVIGDKSSRYLSIFALITALVIILALIVYGFHSWPMLVILLAVPALIKNIKVLSKPRPKEFDENFPPSVKVGWPQYFFTYTHEYSRVFGSLHMLGILLDILWRRFFVQWFF